VRTIDSPEFSLIQTFAAEVDVAPPPAGPGDDCAVIRPGRFDLCVTTDSVIEGVHFSLPRFSLEDVGHKALAVNLSDLAAMGAIPRWFVCALALPARLQRGVRRIGVGMSRLARRHRAELVGGNVSAADKLSITITAIGQVEPGQALTRQGARPGDALYVSGTLGGARLGLSLLKSGVRRGVARRQLRPEPRIALGRICRDHARAAIDISDGFAQDLAQLCRASRVGARIEADSLPISTELRRRAGTLRRAVGWALAGGEDYELLVAVPPAGRGAFERRCARSGERVTQVGFLTSGTQVRFVSSEGRTLGPPPGFDHFRGLRRRPVDE
jgi:thiamine-monophosphate kinase